MKMDCDEKTSRKSRRPDVKGNRIRELGEPCRSHKERERVLVKKKRKKSISHRFFEEALMRMLVMSMWAMNMPMNMLMNMLVVNMRERAVHDGAAGSPG